jgi:hypothetical protein
MVQLWRCASCKRVFTPSPSALRNNTYPLHVVLDAITLYDLGYSLEQTAEKIRSRFGRRAGRSTIAAWLADHRSLSRRPPALLADADGSIRVPPAEARDAAAGKGTHSFCRRG